MVKKLVSSLLIGVSILVMIPISASAEWKQNNTGWWYADGDSYYTGWKKIDDSWYHFRTDGYMEKGWIKDGAWWYYLQDNGSMATGKISAKDGEYEFDSNGKWLNNDLPKENMSTSTNNSNIKPTEKILNETNNFTWFTDNGNTYFKVMGTVFAYGGWNIDGDIYIFNENGVLQKGEYTSKSGQKYLLGDDGKFIKGITDGNAELWAQGVLTTKSNTNNYEVKLDNSHMMDLIDVYSDDPEKNGVLIQSSTGYKLDNSKPKATVEGKTLYCKTNQYIYLGNIEVASSDSKTSSFPNLAVISESTDDSVVYAGIDIDSEDGFYKKIYPKVIAKKAGKATITMDINGTKTSFDVIVTE